MLTANEILEEYTKCLMDPCYAITEYLKTFDMTQKGFVPFNLFPKQIEIIQAYRDHRFTMVTKPRQAGVSTTTAAYAAIKVLFADPNNPEAILILANKQDMAFEFLDKIKDFITQFPRWVWGSEYYGSPEREAKSIYTTESKKELKLPNGSRVKAVATSKDALRGFSPTWLIMDEAAFIDNGATVFGAALTALGTGGRASLVSTPNGMDALYYKTYEQAQSNDNDFFVVEMKWYQDPRYVINQDSTNEPKEQDLIWINEEDEDDIIKEVRYAHDGDSKESVEALHDYYETMIKSGYKPSSSWYRNMCRGMNNNKRMIAQELDVSFIGSGGNVIDDKYIIAQEKKNVKKPKWVAGDDKDEWIWEQPIEGHQYILASDVARGDGEDSSTIVIIDFTTMTQVMEYKGKLQSDLLGYVVDRYARLYDALVVVDITGGIGVGTINKCMELGTPNLYYGDTTNKPLDKLTHKISNISNEGKYPGFNCASGVRAPVVAHMEMMVRTMGITIRSRRMTSEMKTFVFKNGRPDHMDGYHDDLLMALAYGLWVAENSFKKLIISKEKTKAMLSGWLMTNAGDRTPKEYEGDNFVSKKGRNKESIKRPKFSSQVSKNMQDPTGKYMWLFSGTK
tara:strand:- start:7903 stop:9768 length:1866 start_codon:yes stop_codon:yes gene_type:complete